MRFAQSSFVYYNYSLSYAIRDLHALGYDGIEIWAGRPHMYRNDLDEELGGIKQLLEIYGMKVCNLIPAQFRYPSILCSENEVVRKDSVEYIKTAVDSAVKVGSPSISLCPGMVLFDGNTTQGWKQLLRSFKEIEHYAETKDILLLIEPAHRFETNLILTIDDCIKMIMELESERFGILLDTGHCHVNGEDFREIIPKCSEFPLHIHLDDNSGNSDSHLLPGEGTVDFTGLAESLKEIHYKGFISAELGMAYVMDPHAACKKTIETLNSLFPKET